MASKLSTWIRQTYFPPKPFHWFKTPVWFLAWVLRFLWLGLIVYRWGNPFEAGRHDESFERRFQLLTDGLCTHPIWTSGALSSLKLGTPQPGEGWELIKPKYFFWREEIAYVKKPDLEDVSTEVFGTRMELLKASSEDNSEDEKKLKWYETKDAVATVKEALQKEDEWQRDINVEERSNRMQIITQIQYLQTEWEVYRHNKRWYILLDHNTRPIESSLGFFLSRFDANLPYYLSFGTTTILSSVAVDRLMETDAFAGLSLVEHPTKPTLLETLRNRLGLGSGKLLVMAQGSAATFSDAVLQAAARRRHMVINTSLSHLFSYTAPQWTKITTQNHCDIILGFNNLSPADYALAAEKLRSEPAPAWPLMIQDLWTKLDGFPTWDDNSNYFGRGQWDNVGPTSSNKTRLVYDYWGKEYAEYDDGSWSVMLESNSNECQEICYEGGLPEPWGTRPKCLAYKDEYVDKNGEVLRPDAVWEEEWSGMEKCTFVPWKVVGERNPRVWTMVNDYGGEEWRDCPEMDGSQVVGPRIFAF